MWKNNHHQQKCWVSRNWSWKSIGGDRETFACLGWGCSSEIEPELPPCNQKKNALVFQHVVETGTKYEEMGLDVLLPGDGLDWGSQFQIFVLSNPVLQKQGELSTFYRCGQQSLKYLLSGPFQKTKFAYYCRKEEGRVNWLDESFTYQLSWEILAQRRLSKNTSAMQTLQRMSTAGVGFRVRQASLGEPELWWAAEPWLSAVLIHS